MIQWGRIRSSTGVVMATIIGNHWLCDQHFDDRLMMLLSLWLLLLHMTLSGQRLQLLLDHGLLCIDLFDLILFRVDIQMLLQLRGTFCPIRALLALEVICGIVVEHGMHFQIIRILKRSRT